MSVTWREVPPPGPVTITPAGWFRAGLRGLTMAVVLLAGFAVVLVARAIEAPFPGKGRPLSGRVTQATYKLLVLATGLRLRIKGEAWRGRGAVVANHTSWLDILTLGASSRVFFVSKAEVAGWPVIGLIARIVGTVFITRDPRHAARQKELFEARLSDGDRLLFFPEGTSTDGQRVLPFKTTLFEAFFAPALRDILTIQSVSAIYHPPEGKPADFYGWWGDMAFGQSALRVLSARRQGVVEITFHPPVRVTDFTDRKELARVCEAAVRESHSVARRLSGPRAG